MSWQEYVDSGLIASGNVKEAAFIGLDGTTWARSPGFPSISSTQISSIIKGFSDPSGLRAEGLRVGDDKVFPAIIHFPHSYHACVYIKYITLRADERAIHGKKGSSGVLCIKTKQVLIIGTYVDGMQPGDATKTAEGIADYLLSVGY